MKNNIPVTQLLSGAHQATQSEVVQQLRTLFCTRDARAACACVTCKQIMSRQHHAVRWYAPEKQQYTVAQLESLFDELRFSLDVGAHFVFVLEYADALSLSCANSLLKSLEEPPRGYHFILTTQYPLQILPTIYSRCVVRECKGDDVAVQAQLFLSFFKNPTKTELHECMKEFDKAKITESMTKMLMDELIQYWLQRYTLLVQKGDIVHAQQALAYMDTLTHFLTMLPMPGSAKIFWKTLYSSLLF